MNLNRNGILTIIALSGMIGIWLFCGDPVKPNFENPPEIGNGKQISEFGTSEYQSLYGMYISATGTTPLTFQWYKGSATVTGGTNDTLLFPSLSLSDAAGYYCIVKNTYGSDTSLTCLLTVAIGDSVAPMIQNGKAILNSDSAIIDSPYVMYVEAIGTDTLKYQWYKNSAALSGKTDDSLVFTTLAYADSGYYRCIVTNDFGADTSLKDTLTFIVVNNPPEWTVDTMHTFVYENAACTLNLSDSCTDPDDDPLIYSHETGNPAGDTIVGDTYLFSPTFNDSGRYYISIQAFDGSARDTTVLVLTVINVNRPPEWIVDTMHISMYENAACTLTLSDSCTDPDDDSLTFLPGTGNPVGDTIVGDTYLFTPTFNDSGAYSIVIRAFDGSAYDTVVLALTVININRSPRFQPGLPEEDYYVPEDSTLAVTFKAVDPDGDPVTYSLGLNELPHSDTIVFNDSQLVWKSHFDDSGYFNVAILATDGFETDTGSFLVSVGNVNRPPEIAINTLHKGDTVKVTETKTVSFTVTATDPDSGSSVYLTPAKNLPTNANYSTVNGAFSFSPDFSVTDGLNSPYLFPDVTFYATDSVNAMGIDSFVIHIAVIDSNSAPVWTEGTVLLAVTEGSTLPCNFKTLFAGDNEGETVSFSKTFGSFNADTSQWSWTPDFSAFLGKTDTVCTITASDNHTPPASSELKLIITVSDSTPAVTLSSPTHVAYNSIGISWTQSSDAEFSAYKIFYSTSPNVNESSLPGPTITNQLKTNDTVTGLAENTSYYIKVYVYNTNLSKAGSNEINATTSLLGAPTIVINIPTVYNDSASLYVSTPTISGTAGSDAGIASVTAKINGNGVSVTGTASWNFSAATAYTNKKAWNLIEITATDNASKFTTDSFYVFYKPDLAVPVKPVIADTTNRSISLSWSAITDCDRYLVHRSRDGVNYIVVKDTTGTNYTDRPLDINTQYWYKIKGYYTAQGVSDSTDESPQNSAKTENWFECVYDFGGENEYGYDICKSVDGGYIVAGATTDNSGSRFELLIKINKSGDTLWTKRFNNIDGISSVEQTSDNGFIVTGGAGGKVYLMKTDVNGNLNWLKQYIGENGVKAYEAIYDPNNGYVIFSSTGENSTRIIKTDASGDSLWARKFGYDPLGGVNHCQGGLLLTDGGYLSLGYVCNGGSLLSKVNAQGDSLWSKPYYECGQDTCIKPSYLAQANDGHFVILGVNQNSTLIKVGKDWSPLKNVFWRREYSFSPDYSYQSVANTADGGFIIAGYADSYINLVKTDASGNQIYHKNLGDGNSITVCQVLQTTDGGYILCGYKKVGTNNKIYVIKTNENGEIGK